jgi:superfamily II DNA/RNA helicase
VLDEADEMLDLGFLPDVERILELVNVERQTMLFSATMPGPVVTMARRFMKQPTHIRAEEPDEKRTVPDTAIHVYRAHAMDKVEVLARILQAEGRGLTMVFCRTKRTCDKVAEQLVERGFAAAAVHGDLGRERASRRSARSAAARSTCWSPPTSRRAASTSRTSRTSSTTSAPTTRAPSCTASAAPAARARAASP